MNNPKFDEGVTKLNFYVTFTELSGDLSKEELASLLKSKDVKIRLEYLPTKAIRWINSDFAWKWSAWLPIPSGWELVPRLETITLHAGQFQVTDDLAIQFSADKSISKYYVLNTAEIEIPNPAKSIQWQLQPFKLRINLASAIDIEYPPVTYDKRSEKITPLGLGGHQAPFHYETILFGATGTVHVDGAYPMVNQAMLDIFQDEMPANDQVVVQDKLYRLLPQSKYARYELALKKYDYYFPSTQYDQATKEYIDLESELANLYRFINSSSKQELVKMHDYERQNFEERINSFTKLKVSYSDKKSQYIERFNQSKDWPPVERAYTNQPTTFGSMKVDRNKSVYAKVDGHLLEYIDVNLNQEVSKDTAESCYADAAYELFLVDRKLVSFTSSQHVCPSASYAEKQIVSAKWNDDGKLVLYKEYCDYCEQKPIKNTPTQADLENINKMAAKIEDTFLEQYSLENVLASAELTKVNSKGN